MSEPARAAAQTPVTGFCLLLKVFQSVEDRKPLVVAEYGWYGGGKPRFDGGRAAQGLQHDAVALGQPEQRRDLPSEPEQLFGDLRRRTPDGHWHSATKVRVPARPILPRSGELPSRWAEAFEAVAREQMDRSTKG